MEIVNNKLVVDVDGSTMQVPLPEVAGTSKVKAWKVPTAYKAGGLFVAVTQPGQPEEIPACDPASAEFLGEVELEASDAGKLSAAKAAKLVEINTACEAAGSALLAGYPEAEVKTWPQQAAEAAALDADPAASAPLLTAIAAGRGLDVAELVARVLAKEALYKTAAGGLLGQRQALEDAIDAATTIEAVGAISWP
jgi:hypothetical protein